MTLDKLDLEEKELFKKVFELNKREFSADSKEEFQEIHSFYRQIHKQYAELASKDIEALKRGLFLQWYAMTEPIYLTGISNLDEKAEILIIEKLNESLENNSLDEELNWMFNHYSNWNYAFSRFENYTGLKKAIENRKENELPERIDKKLMENRGQMGQYWCSFFKK